MKTNPRYHKKERIVKGKTTVRWHSFEERKESYLPGEHEHVILDRYCNFRASHRSRQGSFEVREEIVRPIERMDAMADYHHNIGAIYFAPGVFPKGRQDLDDVQEPQE